MGNGKGKEYIKINNNTNYVCYNISLKDIHIFKIMSLLSSKRRGEEKENIENKIFN